MQISVVVPTYNRCQLLRRCLAAVTNQDHPAYEVIVVDDASTDATGQMVRREFPQVRYLRQPARRGPAAARNRGIAEARGAIVAFTDDDCVPPRHWLQQLCEGFERFPQAGAIGGIQEPPEQLWRHNLLARYERYLTRQVYRVGERPVLGHPAPIGSNNLAVRRDLLLQLDGFDETFPSAAGEDTDLLRRLADQGYASVSLPLAVEHHQEYRLAAFCRQQVRRGSGAAHYRRKHALPRAPVFLAARLIALPGLFVRDLWHARSVGLAAVRSLSRLCQAWGELTAVWQMRREPAKYAWRNAPSPVKLGYLERYAVGTTALDMGSGAGFYSRLLQRRGMRVVAIDLDPHAARTAPFVCARLAAIPLAASFDTVLAFDILEHEEDEAGALAELRRLTRRRLVLSVPNADDELLGPYNLTYKHHIDKTHRREYHASELRRKLEAAGFRLLVLRAEGPVSAALLAEFVRPTWLRAIVHGSIKLLQHTGLLHNQRLMADLYAVAEVAD